jgi:hypothetical protein
VTADHRRTPWQQMAFINILGMCEWKNLETVGKSYMKFINILGMCERKNLATVGKSYMKL